MGRSLFSPISCSPNDGLKEDEQGLDEHGGVHDVQSLNVLLVPAETEQEVSSGRGGRGTQLVLRAHFLIRVLMDNLRGKCHCCPILQIRKWRLREVK